MRIGVDFGGTKIEAAAFTDDGVQCWRERVATPRADYAASIRVTAELVARCERDLGKSGSIGVGIPGTMVPSTGLVKNANSTWLIGKPFKADLEAAFGRDIRMANDANCLALSEANAGAGAGRQVVFAAILGTGCGGGVALDGHVLEGLNGVAGEFGHNPLPWQRSDEYPGVKCYCGRHGCIETWVSGTAFEREYRNRSGGTLRAAEVVARASAGDADAGHVLAQYEDRLARALAHLINVLDPHVIVLGGGMSNVTHLYETVPKLLPNYTFGACTVGVVPAMYGDSSGVRGAALL